MSDTSLIDNFLHEIDDNEEANKRFAAELDKLDDDEILELLKKTNPYGATVPNKDGHAEKSASFSFTNMRMEFMKELVTTGVIGYLFQRCMIYEVPDEVRPISIEEYLKKGDSACLPPAFITDNALKEKYRQAHETMKERVIIYKFLNEVFQYNPDKHVRSSWYPVKDDETRNLIGTHTAKTALKTKNTVRKINPDQDHNPEMKDLPDDTKMVELGQKDNPCYEVIPAADYYESFKNYFEDNYDDLVKTVYNITGSRPDIDIAINIYDTHNTVAEATAFRSDHMDEVIAGIYNISTNKWAVLAPYAKNKEKEDYFNRETMHLKGMLDSREDKEKLAKDMLKKRIHIKKKLNVKEHGPDSDKFKAWAKQNNSNTDSFGKEYKSLSSADDSWELSTPELNNAANSVLMSRSIERQRIAKMHPDTVYTNPTDGMTEAQEQEYQKTIVPQDSQFRLGADTSGNNRRKFTLEDQDECPDNAVEVGVYKISNGGLNFHQDKIYTESEAPDNKKTVKD